jgi:hypothetical protein
MTSPPNREENPKTTKLRRLRFLRNRMVAVTDYSRVDEGSASVPEVAPPFRYAGTVRDHGAAINYILVALDRIYDADEEITTTVQWTLTGAFLSEWQAVTCRIQDEVTSLTMKVIWPADRESTDITLHRALDRAGENLCDQVKTTAGRKYYECELSPQRGDVITIRWRWSSPASVAMAACMGTS